MKPMTVIIRAKASMRRRIIAGAVALWPAAEAAAADLAADARGFLSEHCLACHDAGAKKGGLDLTSLSWRPDDPKTFGRWVEVFDKVDGEQMPPPSEDRPALAERSTFLGPLRQALRDANLARQSSEGRVVLRRLNRVEYENTVHDLLAIDIPLQPYLPEDASSHGFDNVSEGLRLSMLHMEQYLEAADAAISAALDLRRRPETLRKRLRYHDEESVRDDLKKSGRKSFLVLPEAVVIFSDNSPTALRQWSVKARGRYRIRVAASAYQPAGRPAWLKLYATNFKVQRLLGYFDLPVDIPREVEVVADLEEGELLNLSPYDTDYDDKGRGIYGIGSETYKGRGVAVKWVEVEGPLLESWPPSVNRLFGAIQVRPIEKPKGGGNDGRAAAFTVAPADPRSAAEAVLREFASRAFRRPVEPAEVARYARLAHKGLDEGRSFEDAMRVAFRAVLASPRFLFLDEAPGPLDDRALACRLSYFLGSTPPDDELRDLAARGELGRPEILRRQVERLLDSPRAGALVEDFVGQWLELRQIDFTRPDRKLYPEFDDILKAAMVGETRAFFAELLRTDAPLSNLIHSDFLMLNRRIAEHYGITGITGEEFRRVPLPSDCHRGGVLTQASVLKVTANGTVSSPVLRGAWVMRRLLGEPPPPPPANVPTFEPDTRGTTTVREQLARHRDQAACAGCHARIDPPGFALEGFDVIGGWRDRYRAEKGDPARTIFRGREVWEYKLGPKVDASGETADGKAFRDIDEFKRLLMAREDQVARTLAQNLLTYATGAGVQFADREVVESILAGLKARGGGLRTLIHEIVQSRTFRTK